MEELEQLEQWIGKKETAIDYITVPAVHRTAAMLDRDDPVPRIGESLPLGWHAILFPRVVRGSLIDPDGLPARGDFRPPVPLPRQMFAGKRVTFHDDLRIGDEVQRESTIQDITIKQGRTGQMVFVTIRTDICSPRALALTEEQTIVYREAPDANAPAPPPQPAPDKPAWEKIVNPDPVMIFRFSALTFNAHRIHYDLPYATGAEGYPGLVVNGGLTTLFMFELAREHARSPIVRISTRNVRPLIVGHSLHVCGAPGPEDRTVKLWVTDHEGALALTADAELA